MVQSKSRALTLFFCVWPHSILRGTLGYAVRDHSCQGTPEGPYAMPRIEPGLAAATHVNTTCCPFSLTSLLLYLQVKKLFKLGFDKMIIWL